MMDLERRVLELFEQSPRIAEHASFAIIWTGSAPIFGYLGSEPSQELLLVPGKGIFH